MTRNGCDAPARVFAFGDYQITELKRDRVDLDEDLIRLGLRNLNLGGRQAVDAL